MPGGLPRYKRTVGMVGQGIYIFPFFLIRIHKFGMFEMMSDWASLLVENVIYPPEVNP